MIIPGMDKVGMNKRTSIRSCLMANGYTPQDEEWDDMVLKLSQKTIVEIEIIKREKSIEKSAPSLLDRVLNRINSIL
jgi:hypothetical protein